MISVVIDNSFPVRRAIRSITLSHFPCAHMRLYPSDIRDVSQCVCHYSELSHERLTHSQRFTDGRERHITHLTVVEGRTSEEPPDELCWFTDECLQTETQNKHLSDVS